MSDEQRRERDLVLAPNEFAYILDETKGNINIISGPNKTSLSATDKPVTLDYDTKRFESCTLQESIQLKKSAPEGWYIILKNPSPNGNEERPTDGSNVIPKLQIGRKINIPGPDTFALWPGQMAKVIEGHRLRNNEYLLIRVYDEAVAKANWKENALAISSADGEGESGESGNIPKGKNIAKDIIKPEDLKMGKLLIIKGTDVSFFIPPTGVEVHPDTRGEFVREAVTLEQIEYCILIDQNGNKRYERGPNVVFPKPTERFITSAKSEDKLNRKFRAIELNPNSGIYIKIIADYEDGDDKFIAGQELFITGKDQPIYFPREEHAIIKYEGEDGEEQEIHYGIAIPKGEARYVMNRDTGDIKLARGPQILLPDPRKEVIVKRILDPKMCELMYPGNREAMVYNTQLLKDTTGFDDYAQALAAGITPSAAAMAFSDGDTRGLLEGGRIGAAYDNSHRRFARSAAKEFGGDSFERKNEYTKPRTIIINSKYDGAVAVGPHTGYAIMVVDKSGVRRVVEGPQTVLLEYDEALQVLEFSTGNPKTDKAPIKQVYLRVVNNKVSDTIRATTQDFCEVSIPVSYRVNFDPAAKDKWFDVENYIKLLCEHMRSKIRNAVMRTSVENFYRNSTDIIRDTVLGVAVKGEGGEEKRSRPGFVFEENGMIIYDVEVLDISLKNEEIQKLLTSSERDVIRNNLGIAAEKRRLEYVQQSEEIKQKIAESQFVTRRVESQIEKQDIENKLATDLTVIAAEIRKTDTEQQGVLDRQQTIDSIADAERARESAAMELDITFGKKRLDLKTAELMAEVEAIAKQGQVFTPDLISALERFGDDDIVKRAVEALGPLKMLQLAGGDSIADVFQKAFKGTVLEKALPEALGGAANGKSLPQQQRPS